METATGLKKDTEVLCMSVGRTHEPENNVRFHERPLVGFRLITSAKQLKDLHNAWAAIFLDF